MKKKNDKIIEQVEEKQKKRSALRETAGFLTETGLWAGAGALVGISNYFYDFSMKPVKRDTSKDKEPDQRLYKNGREWMNRHPDRRDWYDRAEDGLRIHANFIPSPIAGGDHRYAICVHGYADSAESTGIFAQVYHDVYGMNVVLPDLRGHGKSEGTYVGYGYHDRRDLIIWIDRILTMDPDASIILHGLSMGAATVMMVTGEKIPANIKACIEDCGFSTALEEFAHVYSTLKQKPPISSDILLPITRQIAKIRAGYDLGDAAPIEAVKRSVTPTLFIHGEADKFIPISMMTKLFEAASCEKMCMTVPGAGHVKSVTVDPEKYWAKIESFLQLVDPALVERRAGEDAENEKETAILAESNLGGGEQLVGGGEQPVGGGEQPVGGGEQP